MQRSVMKENRDELVYKAIVSYTIENLYPPTIDEIMQLTNIKGKQTIINTLEELSNSNKIIYKKGARSIRLVGYKIVKDE